MPGGMHLVISAGQDIRAACTIFGIYQLLSVYSSALLFCSCSGHEIRHSGPVPFFDKTCVDASHGIFPYVMLVGLFAIVDRATAMVEMFLGIMSQMMFLKVRLSHAIP
jgi:hypothetical protein